MAFRKQLLFKGKEYRSRKDKSHSVRQEGKVCFLNFHPDFDPNNSHILLGARTFWCGPLVSYIAHHTGLCTKQLLIHNKYNSYSIHRALKD